MHVSIAWLPSSVAARSIAYVCGPLMGGIAGLNPAEGVEVLQLCLLCIVLVVACAKS
jgi:hypothetical protein